MHVLLESCDFMDLLCGLWNEVGLNTGDLLLEGVCFLTALFFTRGDGVRGLLQCLLASLPVITTRNSCLNLFFFPKELMDMQSNLKELLSGAVAFVVLAAAIVFTLLLNGGDFTTTMLPFDLKDKTIDYPVLEDTIGGVANVVIHSILTISLMGIWLLLQKKKFKDNRTLFYLAIYFVLLGGVLVNLFTNVFKHLRGGLRPHFLKACIPNEEIVRKLNEEGITWVNITLTKIICTAKGKPEYRWSFPSGHSSEAFFGGILSILILQKLPILQKSPELKSQLESLWLTARASLQFLILTFSSWVAVSRLVDYHHHWWDVLAGSLLGVLFAVVLFYWYLCPIMKCIEESPDSGTQSIEPSGGTVIAGPAEMNKFA
ncbi:hypothetical protein ACHWQZ_G018484 [Mnemiopsis leidyi]